jgi:hypothetical protein
MTQHQSPSPTDRSRELSRQKDRVLAVLHTPSAALERAGSAVSGLSWSPVSLMVDDRVIVAVVEVYRGEKATCLDQRLARHVEMLLSLGRHRSMPRGGSPASVMSGPDRHPPGKAWS